MKNSKSIVFLVLLYVGFSLYIGYTVYKGIVNLQHTIEFKHGNFKIPSSKP